MACSSLTRDMHYLVLFSTVNMRNWPADCLHSHPSPHKKCSEQRCLTVITRHHTATKAVCFFSFFIPIFRPCSLTIFPFCTHAFPSHSSFPLALFSNVSRFPLAMCLHIIHTSIYNLQSTSLSLRKMFAPIKPDFILKRQWTYHVLSDLMYCALSVQISLLLDTKLLSEVQVLQLSVLF